jgi:hypothetical protein
LNHATPQKASFHEATMSSCLNGHAGSPLGHAAIALPTLSSCAKEARMSSNTFLAVFLSFVVVAAAGCAVDSSEDPAAPADPAAADTAATADDGTEAIGTTAEELTALTFASVGPKVANTCGGCHAKFKTLAGIKADKAAMIAKITAGAMPKGNPAWKKSADGKKVLKWLKTGADLK